MGQSHAKQDITPEEFDRMIRTSSFGNGEIHELHQKFQREFPKGYIDKKGFKHMYMTMFPQGSGAEKFADHIFRIYDADGNGHISFQELIATLSVSASGSKEDKLRATFRLYDVDRNGLITQKELTEILSVSLQILYTRVYMRSAQNIIFIFF
jgi:Ca2+-binding EF-hand superfamily protein